MTRTRRTAATRLPSRLAVLADGGLEHWRARTPRERWMLATMCLAVAAFVSWFAILAPLRTARETAQARHARALQDAAAIEHALAALPDPQGTAGARDHAAQLALIVDSAALAGLGVERRAQSAGGGIEVDIDAASAAALFGWLDTLRLEHGIAPSGARIERRDGRLRATFEFPAS